MHCPEKCRIVASFEYYLLSEMLLQRSSCGPDFLLAKKFLAGKIVAQVAARSRKKLPACGRK